MGVYKLSIRCESDLTQIFEYGIEQFGLKQSKEYLLALHKLFLSLADHNYVGMHANDLFPGLRKIGYKSHMIFIIITDQGIHVLRVLHQSMDYQRHISG